jgi:D-alanyl-D-alanine endopeptidase (penicillin-binding protein 7)
VPIASITKLMTAMVVLDSKAPLDERLTVTDEDRDYEKGTGSRLSIGSTLSREDMLHIALMASENRAAAALSRYYPGGRPGFIAAMNRKAAELGMAQTHFQNATGLTSQNVSSARDLAKMVNAAYRYPLIRQFSTDRSYDVFTGKRMLAYNSTNALVRNASWDIGLQKTGFINEAGECLVMQATIHGRPVIMVLLDSFGKYSRFADAQRLRNWMDTGGVQRVTSAQTNGAGT